MDEQQKAFAEEVAKLVAESVQPAVFTPVVTSLLITTFGAVLLAFITNYFKMRTIQSQIGENTTVTVKAQNAAVAAAKLGVENKGLLVRQDQALPGAVEVLNKVLDKKTQEIKEAIVNSDGK